MIKRLQVGMLTLKANITGKKWLARFNPTLKNKISNTRQNF
jgi:hypothetical protein